MAISLPVDGRRDVTRQQIKSPDLWCRGRHQLLALGCRRRIYHCVYQVMALLWMVWDEQYYEVWVRLVSLLVSVTSSQCHLWSVSFSSQSHFQSVSPPVRVTSSQCHFWSVTSGQCHFRSVSFPGSVTSGQCHFQAVSLPVSVTSSQCHFWSASLLVSFTSGQFHFWSVSLLVSVTFGQCHFWSESLPGSVTSSQSHFWLVSLRVSVTFGQSRWWHHQESWRHTVIGNILPTTTAIQLVLCSL